MYILLFCQNGAGLVSLDGEGPWWSWDSIGRQGTGCDRGMGLGYGYSMAWMHSYGKRTCY